MSPDPDDAVAPDDPPTTKEGWRRFVDYQPEPPPALDASELLAMSRRDRAALDEARRDYHAGLPLVNTPTIRAVLSTGRLLVQLNRRQVSARRGLILSGASGTGKTTALTQLGRTHERAVRKRHPHQTHRLPVIYVTVPPAATARMVAVEFGRFFGLEFTRSANITDVVNAVCATAAHTGVELVLVEEIHNISLASRTGAEVSDQLKYFAERLPATFVYAGLEVEAQGLFAGVRRGGRGILYHRHLNPVLARDWSIRTDLFISTVATSADTRTFHHAASRPVTAEDATNLVSAEYVRLTPAPSDYLDAAITPAPWPIRASPWQPGEGRPTPSREHRRTGKPQGTRRSPHGRRSSMV